MSDQERSLVKRKESSPVPTGNRILLLGSRLSGAFELGGNFQAYLEERGIPSPVVEVLRDAGSIERAFLGREDVSEGRSSPNLPKGVILLPEMRQYTLSGHGMFLSTYECGINEFIEGLCARYGVPLVEIRSGSSLEKITEGIKHLLSKTE